METRLVSQFHNPYLAAATGTLNKTTLISWSYLHTLLGINTQMCTISLLQKNTWLPWSFCIPSCRLTWQWIILILCRKYIFKGSIFHCYVSLQECTLRIENTRSSWFKPWSFYPLVGGYQQPLISGHILPHHPKKGHELNHLVFRFPRLNTKHICSSTFKSFGAKNMTHSFHAKKQTYGEQQPLFLRQQEQLKEPLQFSLKTKKLCPKWRQLFGFISSICLMLGQWPRKFSLSSMTAMKLPCVQIVPKQRWSSLLWNSLVEKPRNWWVVVPGGIRIFQNYFTNVYQIIQIMYIWYIDKQTENVHVTYI